ncbi:PQ-loop domain-containing transporter [Mycoplasma sp. 4463]|uniref:PQ-loop domain-containing transporter n=1 Tax=Mycoplasma sp. 4463 TaxID=3400998 RepID=UPI003AAC0922
MLTALETAFGIIKWICAITVISLSIPQLLKILKDKKTGPVNFVSFWIFHIGILLWVIWGATDKNNEKFITVMVADGVGILVNGIMTGLLYYYKKEFTNKQKLQGYLAVLATWIIAGIFTVFYIIDYGRAGSQKDPYIIGKLHDSISTAMGFIFPAFTTFAFLPQLITSFKTKQWQGVSYWMYVLYVVNNIIWIVYWILLILINEIKGLSITSAIGGLVWQSISLTLFSIQLGFTLHDKFTTQKTTVRHSHRA